jgi:import inner membrane translocase subunit TIM17
MDHTRDPCPWVALNDFGGAFCMGVSTIRSATTSLCGGMDTNRGPIHPHQFDIPSTFQNPRMLTFCIQAIGGAVWHGVKGFRNSPYGERRIGALTAIKARAPVLGGNFGVWGGLFSTFDCAVKGVRKKEDPYNASMCL